MVDPAAADPSQASASAQAMSLRPEEAPEQTRPSKADWKPSRLHSSTRTPLPVSAASEVTPLPVMPQGTMREKNDRSGAMLSASPWEDTPPLTRMPTCGQQGPMLSAGRCPGRQIPAPESARLRQLAVAHPHARRRWHAAVRRNAVLRRRVDGHVLQRFHKPAHAQPCERARLCSRAAPRRAAGRDRKDEAGRQRAQLSQPQDRVGHQLPWSVVSHVATAAGSGYLNPKRRKLLRRGAATSAAVAASRGRGLGSGWGRASGEASTLCSVARLPTVNTWLCCARRRQRGQRVGPSGVLAARGAGRACSSSSAPGKAPRPTAASASACSCRTAA